MIQTTTPTIEGQKIDRYHGVVTGEAILGANIFKDFFASVRDIVDEMTQQATERGANAIVGIDIDYETVGTNGGMLMVSVSGTAVSAR